MGLSAALVAVARAASAQDLAPLTPSPAAQLSAPDAAPPFVLPVGGAARDRAVACLTAAIYYEAGREPRDGQEAVAQVVLNRVRHPGFPKSVCGVVYEGAGRATGCQFSFTCAGSTRRRPLPARWRAAEAVALAALDGHVAAEVGASTHYHALSVRPAWRTTLVQTARIGAHVFYRMPGALGSPAALIGVYSADEPSAPPGEAASAASAPAARPAPGAALFQVWGLPVADVAVRRREIVISPAPAS
jgi:hypothetical protein